MNIKTKFWETEIKVIIHYWDTIDYCIGLNMLLNLSNLNSSVNAWLDDSERLKMLGLTPE